MSEAMDRAREAVHDAADACVDSGHTHSVWRCITAALDVLVAQAAVDALREADCFEAFVRDAETCIELEAAIKEQNPNGILDPAVRCNRCTLLIAAEAELAAATRRRDGGEG